MNKIEIAGYLVNLKETDNKIILEKNDKEIVLIINQNTDIELKVDGINNYNFIIKILPNIIVNIFELNQEINSKNKYIYEVEENSILNINKFYDTNNSLEENIILLNGIKSQVNFNLKTIAKDEIKFDIKVYHNCRQTKCNVNNKGISIKDGKIIFDVSSYIENGITDCETNQYNYIITLNNKKNIIKPNLYIEEENVIANHSAYIGKFDEDIIFYLETRGISKKEAINLLIKGFLYEEKTEIKKIIDKYWR